MKDTVSTLTRVLIGACTLELAASDLAMDVPEVRRLCRMLCNDSAALLPVSMDIESRRVEYLDLQNASYEEAFLSESIEHVRRTGQELLNFDVSFEDHARARNLNAGRPDGFIFHTGRCGSTLLANMLGNAKGSLVLKEPEILNQILAAYLTAGEPNIRDEQLDLLTATLRSFACLVPSRKVLVKTSAWNVGLARVLSELAPGAHSVFLYRDPKETVASLMHQGPGWVDLLRSPRHIQSLFFPDVVHLAVSSQRAPGAFFAHAWNSMVAAALEQPPEAFLFISYDDLRDNTRTVLQKVMTHLRLTISPEELDRLVLARRFYSKENATKDLFEPHGRHQRPSLSSSQENEIDQITRQVASRLQARCTS